MEPNHNSNKLQASILNSIGANSFGQVLGLIYQILAVPLYINAWGISLYGQWLILNTIPGYLALSDFGFVSAAANDMSILTSKNQHQQALKVFQSIWAIILIISILVLIVVVALILFLPSIFAQSSMIDAQELSTIIFCLSAYSLLALQEGLLNSGFRAGGLFTFSLWLGNIQRALEVVLILIALLCKWSPAQISLLMLAVKAISFVTFTIFLSKRVPWIRFGFALVSMQEVRRIMRPAMGFMAFPVANAIKTQGIITLIGILLGATEVVIFSSIRTICNAGQQLLKIVQHSFWPEMSSAYGRQNIELIQRMNVLICGLAFWMGLVNLFLLVIFGNMILFHWTLGKIQAPILLLLVMCLGNFAAGIWSGGSTILMAINQHSRLGAHYLFLTSILALIVFFFGHLFDLLGYVALFSAMEIFLAIVVLSQTMPLINQSFLEFTKDVVKLPIHLAHLALNSKFISNSLRK